MSTKTAPDPFSMYCMCGGRGNSWRAGGEGGDITQGERVWSSLGRQKVKPGLLLIIHILWDGLSDEYKSGGVILFDKKHFFSFQDNAPCFLVTGVQ
jgi:hypothetical protein